MKNIIVVLLSMLALTYFAVACGDDDSGSESACDKMNALYEDVIDKLCDEDAYKDCSYCTEETTEALSSDAGVESCDEETAQKVVDAWNDEAAEASLAVYKAGCDAEAAMSNLLDTDTDSATE